MRFVFTSHGWEDYTFWQATDRATSNRISRMLDDVARDPSPGSGNPSSSVTHSLELGHVASTRNTASCTSSKETT